MTEKFGDASPFLFLNDDRWKDAVVSDGVLLCPECGGEWLHHGALEAFVRGQEDAPTGLHAKVGDGDVLAEHAASMRANPSSRRDGLLIEFSCENCGFAVPYVLAIVQHKGQTLVYWQKPRTAGRA